MEAVTMHGSLDQSISPFKSHLKNRKIINQNPIFSTPGDGLWPSQFNSTGLLQPPPPFLSQYTLQQPPLLPLPAGAPRLSAPIRTLSCPAVNQKTSNPKKSKSPKKVDKNSPKKSASGMNKCDAMKLKNGSSLLKSSSGPVVGGEKVGVFLGSVPFAASPPPSSLPLPTFSLRRKMGCKAEAVAGIDAGATDDLRRLLRLP